MVSHFEVNWDMFGVCFVIIVGSLLRSELVAKLEGRKRMIEFQYAIIGHGLIDLPDRK